MEEALIFHLVLTNSSSPASSDKQVEFQKAKNILEDGIVQKGQYRII